MLKTATRCADVRNPPNLGVALCDSLMLRGGEEESEGRKGKEGEGGSDSVKKNPPKNACALTRHSLLT